VKITIYPGSSCDSVLPELEKNWNSEICAGELAGGKDTCFGDSGGSLYAKAIFNGKEKFVSVGITSYGDDCALVGKPG
jgi:complement component 2/CUB/sushi domain-containing protein